MFKKLIYLIGIYLSVSIGTVLVSNLIRSSSQFPYMLKQEFIDLPLNQLLAIVLSASVLFGNDIDVPRVANIIASIILLPSIVVVLVKGNKWSFAIFALVVVGLSFNGIAYFGSYETPT